MKRVSYVPASLKQAQVDGEKPTRFYGTQTSLTKSRSQSAKQTKQRYVVLNMLERIGLK